MIISPDSFLYDEGGTYVWSVERVKAAWESAKKRYKTVLGWPIKPEKVVLMVGAPASGKSTWLSRNANERVLYFDATFDLPWKRRPYIDIAHSIGVPVEIVWLHTPLEVCIERNAARSEDRRVPVEVVEAMYHKILSAPPDEKEGVALAVVTP